MRLYSSRHPDARRAIGEIVGSHLDASVRATGVAVVLAVGTTHTALADLVEVVDALMHPELVVGLGVAGVQVNGGLPQHDGIVVAIFEPGQLAVQRIEISDDQLPVASWCTPNSQDALFNRSCGVIFVDDSELNVEDVVELLPGHVAVAFATPPGPPRMFIGHDEFDDGGVCFTFSKADSRVVSDLLRRPSAQQWTVTAGADAATLELAFEPVGDVIASLGHAQRDVLVGLVGVSGDDVTLEVPSTEPSIEVGDVVALWTPTAANGGFVPTDLYGPNHLFGGATGVVANRGDDLGESSAALIVVQAHALAGPYSGAAPLRAAGASLGLQRFAGVLIR